MGANLITGNLFSPITAAEDSDFQAGICGNVTTIMPVGSEMALSILDANTISAADGVVITKEGRRIQIDIGDTEEFTIPTGTQGVTAYYIIGFHLYTDNDTGAELCETFVEAVESSSSTITENTFRDGNTEVYVSLGMVVQDGVNLDSVTALLSVADSIESLSQAISQLNTDLDTVKDRLSDKSTIGTPVILTNNVTFTVPSDGYVRINGRGIINFSSSYTPDSPTPLIVNRTDNSTGAVQRVAVFVRKGMNVIWTNEAGDSGVCSFFPLTN